jgi:hypothetical protein
MTLSNLLVPALVILQALQLTPPAVVIAAAADAAGGSKFVTVVKEEGSPGVWWLQRDGKRFLSLGVSNLNNGGEDDGVGGVLRDPCRAQMGSVLCGDTNNWDMVARYSPYNNITRALFNRSSTEASDEAWAADAASRLQGWDFNTISGYSSAVAERAVGARGMFYNRLLMFGTRFAEPSGTPLQKTSAGGCFSSDVFSDDFQTFADQYAKENVLPRADDPALLGWHFDKEVSWTHMDLRYWLNPELFNASAPGRRNATEFLRARYNGNIAALSRAWNCSGPLAGFEDLSSCISPAGARWTCLTNLSTGGRLPSACDAFACRGWAPHVDHGVITKDSQAFILVFAQRYFNVVTAAIRRYDTNHLLLGMRGGCFGFPPMLKLFSSYIDLYDLHHYGDPDDRGTLLAMYEQVHNVTGLPILHGEFSYTAIDSGVPNLRGARSCSAPTGDSSGGSPGAAVPGTLPTSCRPGSPYILQRALFYCVRETPFVPNQS